MARRVNSEGELTLAARNGSCRQKGLLNQIEGEGAVNGFRVRKFGPDDLCIHITRPNLFHDFALVGVIDCELEVQRVARRDGM